MTPEREALRKLVEAFAAGRRAGQNASQVQGETRAERAAEAKRRMG
jgi:hypothetical protein